MTFVSKLARVVTMTMLAGAASLSLAQSAGSAAKKDLVQKALTLQQTGIEGLGNQVAGQTANQVLNAAGQVIARMPADKRELTANEIQAEVRKFFEDVAPGLRSSAVKLAPGVIGVAMEERFSEDELKTLVAWLESPVSKKFQQMVVETQQQLGQKLVADNRGTIEPKLKALEQSISKKLGLPAAGASAPAAGAKK